jgi:high-affinity iron transporter
VIPSFIIFLREGIEASMIVAMLLAYLNKTGKRQYFRDVYVGVGAALLLVIVGGIAVYLAVRHYSGSNVQTYIETTTYLLAALFLTLMTFWMSRHARSMNTELQTRSDVALSSGKRWGLGVLSAQAVGREGLETMVFTLAILFTNTSQAGTPLQGRGVLVGAISGLAVALGLSYLMYKMGTKINLKVFFRVLGVVLMIFAAGLIADAVENLQSLGWLKVGTQVLWHSGNVLNEGSNLGDIAHSLLGYAQSPTLAQAVVWVLYVGVSVSYFLAIGRRPQRS